MSKQPVSPQPQAYAAGYAVDGYQPKFPQNQPQPPQAQPPASEAEPEAAPRRRKGKPRRRHHSLWGYILMFIGLMTVLFLVFKYIVVPLLVLLASGMGTPYTTGGTLG